MFICEECLLNHVFHITTAAQIVPIQKLRSYSENASSMAATSMQTLAISCEPRTVLSLREGRMEWLWGMGDSQQLAYLVGLQREVVVDVILCKDGRIVGRLVLGEAILLGVKPLLLCSLQQQEGRQVLQRV